MSFLNKIRLATRFLPSHLVERLAKPVGEYLLLTTPEWIANLQPQVILLNVSLKDAMGLPSPDALQAMEGYTLLRIDRKGWIELSTDGKQMWVAVERKPARQQWVIGCF